MTLNDIKSVTPIEIFKACSTLTKHIQEKYKGTKWKVDTTIAAKVFKFILTLKHTGGGLAGTHFRLLPFQAEFLIEVLCVVSIKTGFRKHKEAILFIPRKAGKTELGAALNLVMFHLDEEKQKEIYSIAAETTQAAILYKAAVSMMNQSPLLAPTIKQYKAEKKLESITKEFPDIYRVLSAVAGTKDGLKTSTLFADEPHAYPDSSLYDVVSEGMAHRDQPLAILLSTAGYNKQGFFHKKLNYAKQVMDGIIDDPSIYLMDFSVNDDDDWTDEENWIKANPALGFGVKMDYLRDKFHKALHSATDEVSFRTKHLNMWVDSAVTWIKHKDWVTSNQKEFTEADLIGRECYVGLDLSSTTDITSYAMAFPNEDGSYDILSRNFIPEDTATVRAKEDKVSYLDWARTDALTLTQGNVIDYQDLFVHIMKDVEKFDVKELSFDRWNATSIITKLEEQGVLCVAHGQGYKSMSPATKAVESLTLQKKINHGNNPVLTWCISNVCLQTDAAENVKIDKSKSQERVDAAVALAMAINRAESYRDEEANWDSLIG